MKKILLTIFSFFLFQQAFSQRATIQKIQASTIDSVFYETDTLTIVEGANTFKTEIKETDPVYTNSSWFSTTNNSTNWDASFGWGNHATQGYLRGETDPVFGNSPAFGITSTNIGNWNTAYNWGDHSAAGYLTSHLWTEDTNGLTYQSGNVGIGVASSSSNLLTIEGGINYNYLAKIKNNGSFGQGLNIEVSSTGTFPVLSVNSLTSDLFRVDANGSIKMSSIPLNETESYIVGYNPSTKYISYLPTPSGTGSSYSGWVLWTNGTNRGTISDSEVVNFAAGTNMTLSYNSTNNTITFNSASSGGESLWSEDSYGINYAVAGKHVGIGNSAEPGYVLNVDRSLAGWAGRFRNTSTSGHGIQIVTGNTSGSYNALQLANSQGAIMYVRNAGNLRLHSYGTGSFTGTVAKYLAVDASGNVIEAEGTGGGTGTPGGASGSIQYNNSGSFDGFGNYNGSRVRVNNRLSVYNSISSYPYMHLITGENIGYLGWNSSDASTIQGGFTFDPVSNRIEVTNATFKPTTITDENNSTGAVGEVLKRTSTGIDWAADDGGSSLWTDAGTYTYLTSTSDNVSIGSIYNNGFKLYVNGNGYFSTALQVNGFIFGTALRITQEQSTITGTTGTEGGTFRVGTNNLAYFVSDYDDGNLVYDITGMTKPIEVEVELGVDIIMENSGYTYILNNDTGAGNFLLPENYVKGKIFILVNNCNSTVYLRNSNDTADVEYVTLTGSIKTSAITHDSSITIQYDGYDWRQIQ